MHPSKIVFSNGDLISLNPTNREEVGRVKVTDIEDIPAMIDRARVAQREWGKLSVRERGKHLLPLADYVYDHQDEFIDIIARECGKPRVEAVTSELFPLAAHVNYLAGQAPKILADEKIPQFWMTAAFGKRGRIVKEPLGVIAVLSPWNYPLWTLAGPVFSALVAGNAVIAKPSEYTPVTADLLRRAVEAIGLPKDLFQMAHGDGRVGSALVSGPVNKIVFVGSTNTGRKVMASAAANLTAVTMELGGNDAAIVLEDADLDNAARGIAWGGFTCSGQVCASIERVFVVESVYADFIQRLAYHTMDLRVGIELEAVEVGSMNNERQFDIVERQVNEAVEQGARVVTGGKGDGMVYKPTILADVPARAEILHRETFGPVLPVEKVKDGEQAVQMANATRFGLTTSIWTRNVKRAEILARDLECGLVTINDHISPAGFPDLPWGGVKDTGFGRVQGRAGLLEMVTPKVIVHETLPVNRLWWFNYDLQSYRLFRQVLVLFTRKSLFTKIKTLLAMPKNLNWRKLL